MADARAGAIVQRQPEDWNTTTVGTEYWIPGSPRAGGRGLTCYGAAMTLRDSTVLVTGGSAGIGFAIAEMLAQAGARVAITGRRADRLKAAADRIGALPIQADVSLEADAVRTIRETLAAFGHLDALINNAGLALGTKPAQEAKLDDWRTMIATNVSALVALTHRLLPGLIERQGAIINLSSVAATYPYTGGNVYGGTKAFVEQFSLGLRSDLHGTGVRVTSIEPGMVETEFTVVRTGGDQGASDTLYKGADPMTAEDIAATMLWVATLPPHLNINRLELMPVSQSFAGFQVARKG